MTRRSLCGTLATSLTVLLALAASPLLLAAPAAHADVVGAHTYYVSATGSDASPGLTPSTAWQTLQAVSSHALSAGDTVLLQGGATFNGPLYLDAADSGVTVGSFGSGRASIVGHGTSGVFGYDTSSITLHDLNVSGDAAAYTSKGGISFYSDRPAGQRLSGITISAISARGFKNGVELGAAHPGAGFARVSITDVTATANRDAGVITYGPAFNPSAPSYAHTGVQVLRTSAKGNLGNPADRVHNSGNGIVLGSVDGGAITSSRASGNGARCTAPEGPVGIWTYDSHGIKITNNVSTGNRTGGSADGDGFDLDQNVSGSFLEHNTSSGNDGAGYLVYTAQTSRAHHDNYVRWNRSSNDARKNSWYGAITLAGRIARVTVTGNTVDTRLSASHPAALTLKAGVLALRVTSNTLYAAPGYRVVVSPKLSTSAVSRSSNRWSTAVQRVGWGPIRYASRAAWTRATGQY
jgi:hypothetical protein